MNFLQRKLKLDNEEVAVFNDIMNTCDLDKSCHMIFKATGRKTLGLLYVYEDVVNLVKCWRAIILKVKNEQPNRRFEVKKPNSNFLNNFFLYQEEIGSDCSISCDAGIRVASVNMLNLMNYLLIKMESALNNKKEG